jgi:hypothetical protein
VEQSRRPGHDCALPGEISQLRFDAPGAAVEASDHRHRADRVGPRAVQPAPSRARAAHTRRHTRRGRHPDRVSHPSAAGDREAADGDARSQSHLSLPGGMSARLPVRRRSADDRLRQDDARVPHGRRHGQPAGDRAVGRSDAERLVRRQTGRIGNGDLARETASRQRRDQRRAVHGDDVRVVDFGRSLQHDGNGVFDERDGRSARHVASRMLGDSGGVPRALGKT